MKNLSSFQPNMYLFAKFNSVPAAILQKISKTLTKKAQYPRFCIPAKNTEPWVLGSQKNAG